MPSSFGDMLNSLLLIVNTGGVESLVMRILSTSAAVELLEPKKK
jgi:hypothetical protein